MADRVLITPSILTDIADAIREKTGSTSTIKPSEMAEEIEDISTGVSVDNSYTVTFSEDNEVKECHIVQQGLSVPTPSYVPTMEWYKFLDNNGNRVSFPYTPTANTELFIVEDEKDYSALLRSKFGRSEQYIAIWPRNATETDVTFSKSKWADGTGIASNNYNKYANINITGMSMADAIEKVLSHNSWTTDSSYSVYYTMSQFYTNFSDNCKGRFK